MLVLTRRVGESVVIGSDTQVSVLSIQGSQVRIGVQAPKIIEVHRREIYDQIRIAEATKPELA